MKIFPKPFAAEETEDGIRWDTGGSGMKFFPFFNFSRVRVKVAQSCLMVCDPMDSTVHGILQARILEWVTFPFSRGSSQPRNQTRVSCIAGGFFTNWAIGEALSWIVKLRIIEQWYSSHWCDMYICWVRMHCSCSVLRMFSCKQSNIGNAELWALSSWSFED